MLIYKRYVLCIMGRLEELRKKKKAEEDARRRVAEETERVEEEDDSLEAGAPAEGSRRVRHMGEMSLSKQSILDATYGVYEMFCEQSKDLRVQIKKTRGTEKDNLQRELDKCESDKKQIEDNIALLKKPMEMNKWLASTDAIEKWITEWESRTFRLQSADRELAKLMKLHSDLVLKHNTTLLNMSRTGVVDPQLRVYLAAIEKLNVKIDNFEASLVGMNGLLNKEVVQAPDSIMFPVQHCVEYLQQLRKNRIDLKDEKDVVILRKIDETVSSTVNLLKRYLQEVKDACDNRFGGHEMPVPAKFEMPTGDPQPIVFSNLLKDARSKSNDTEKLSELKKGTKYLQDMVAAHIILLSEPIDNVVHEWNATTDEKNKWIDEWQRRGERMVGHDSWVKDKIEIRTRSASTREKLMNKSGAKSQKDAEVLAHVVEIQIKNEEEITQCWSNLNESELEHALSTVSAPEEIEDKLYIFLKLIQVVMRLRIILHFIPSVETVYELDAAARSILCLWRSHMDKVRAECNRRRRGEHDSALWNEVRNLWDVTPPTEFWEGKPPTEQRMRWTLQLMQVITYNGGPTDRIMVAYELDPSGPPLFTQIQAIAPFYDWSSLSSRSIMKRGHETIKDLDWTRSDGILTDEMDCREDVNEFGKALRSSTGVDVCFFQLYCSSKGGRDRARR